MLHSQILLQLLLFGPNAVFLTGIEVLGSEVLGRSEEHMKGMNEPPKKGRTREKHCHMAVM